MNPGSPSWMGRVLIKLSRLQTYLGSRVAIAPVAAQRGAVARPTAVIEQHLDWQILQNLRMGCAKELTLLAAATADGQNKQQ